MNRIPRAAALGALVVLGVAAPALAQYDDPTTTTRPTTTTTRPTTTTAAPTTTTAAPTTTNAPTTTPTTVRSSTSTTPESQESTTTTTAPPPVVVKPAPVQVVFEPGAPVQIVAETEVAFDEDVEPTVTVSGTGSDPTTVVIEVVASVDEDGNLVVDVIVPEDAPEGIIAVTIVAVDARGSERTLVYLFPVSRSTTTTTSPALRLSGAKSWDELPVVPVSEVPAIVRQIQASIPDDAAEQSLLTELAADPESVLVIDDATLAVSVRPYDEITDDETARPLVAALAVAVAGGGLLVLRRRVPSAKLVKGSR